MAEEYCWAITHAAGLSSCGLSDSNMLGVLISTGLPCVCVCVRVCLYMYIYIYIYFTTCILSPILPKIRLALDMMRKSVSFCADAICEALCRNFSLF